MFIRPSRALLGAATAFVLSLAPVYSAQAAESSHSSIVYSSLSPGEYVWQPEASARGDVKVVISLPLQVAYVYRGDALIGVSTVSTGKPGHETPTGSFEILQKRQEHYSNLYDNAPMPFMQRLTWDGIALHAGANPGEPASHGCIRMPMDFARALYGVTRLGGTVVVTDAAPTADEARSYVI